MRVELVDGRELLTIDMRDVFDFIASCEIDKGHRNAWNDLERAMGGSPHVIDVLRTLHEAREGYDTYVARMLARSTAYVHERIHIVATTYAQAMDAGDGSVMVRRSSAQGREEWQVDPRSFEGAMETMNWACEVSGLSPCYNIPPGGMFSEVVVLWAQHRESE